MGDIIRLRPRQEARRKSVAVPTGTAGERSSATILLFLGVRYERHDDKSLSPQTRAPRGGRRKRA